MVNSNLKRIDDRVLNRLINEYIRVVHRFLMAKDDATVSVFCRIRHQIRHFTSTSVIIHIGTHPREKQNMLLIFLRNKNYIIQLKKRKNVNNCIK